MRVHFVLAQVAAISCALGTPLSQARALSVSGNAATQAQGGTPQNINLPGPESTTGLVQTVGSCSNAKAQATLSASAGYQVTLSYAEGTPGVACGGSASSYDNVGYQDIFTVQSGSLAPGTLVDLSLCVHAAIRHGDVFACGGNINEVAGNTANADVSFLYGTTSQAAHGTYSERYDCYDPHSSTTTGLYAAGGGQTLTLTQVPVGGSVTVSATTSVTSTATSVMYPSEAHVEVALVLGYSSTSDVKLVSTATATELNPASLCSDSIAASLLPPNPSVVAVSDPGIRIGPELMAPAPNPATGAVSIAFSLPREEPAELGVFNVAGARVARLADGAKAPGLHTLVWDGRDERGRRVGAGLYWLRLVTPDGRSSRAVVKVR